MVIEANLGTTASEQRVREKRTKMRRICCHKAQVNDVRDRRKYKEKRSERKSLRLLIPSQSSCLDKDVWAAAQEDADDTGGCKDDGAQKNHRARGGGIRKFGCQLNGCISRHNRQ